MSEEKVKSEEVRNQGEGGEGRRDSSYGKGMDNDDGEKRRPQRPRYRRKVLDTRNLDLDFKNTEVLERFISKTGKILPRRMTGASARIQRKIAREVKRAREISLLPFTRR